MFQRDIHLASNGVYHSRKVVVLPLAMFLPRCEVAHLTIVAIVCKPHLWSNQEDFTVVDDDATVVIDVLVDNGPMGDRSVLKRKKK